jgi:hypothetical protein
MNQPLSQTVDEQMRRLIADLDSLLEGERAAAMLIASGKDAVPYLERFLLGGPPKTIALPRCRAVHALGELAAESVLVSYLREYNPPADAQVLFAEDAVRSAAAVELLRWKTEQTFQVLLNAAKQRATSGLITALGEFRMGQTVPLLFETLEDDLCREAAKGALRKVPAISRHYAILSIRGLTDVPVRGPFALRRRRATLQLLEEFGVSPEEWQELRIFLMEKDADVVIATASIGLSIGRIDERSQILRALFRISDHLNWFQEGRVVNLLDMHSEPARKIAQAIVAQRRNLGQRPDWLNPAWRILGHILGRELERGHDGA